MVESRELWNGGAFRPAGIGRGDTWEVKPEIRTDHVHWIDPLAPTEPQAAWLAAIEDLRLRINEAMFLGVFDYEGMLAVYPPGSFYARHLDQFRDTQRRLITISLYLNENWCESDGGQLRMYLPDDAAGDAGADRVDHIEVLPLAGTVVIFRSDAIWHEVLPANRERHSLTGWLRRRDG